MVIPEEARNLVKAIDRGWMENTGTTSIDDVQDALRRRLRQRLRHCYRKHAQAQRLG